MEFINNYDQSGELNIFNLGKGKKKKKKKKKKAQMSLVQEEDFSKKIQAEESSLTDEEEPTIHADNMWKYGIMQEESLKEMGIIERLEKKYLNKIYNLTRDESLNNDGDNSDNDISKSPLVSPLNSRPTVLTP